MKTRIHGDLHLGQVVVVREDFHILDSRGSRCARWPNAAPSTVR